MKKLKYLLLIALGIIPVMKVNAATGLIDIYTSNKNPTVGSSFTVTVYCKSSGSAIGGCEYNLSYPSNIILTSGETYNAEVYNNYGDTTITKTFTFKAVSTGSATISATGYDVQDVDTNSLSTSVSPTTVNISTPGSGGNSSSNSSSHASSNNGTYSTNNNLSNLSVEGLTLSKEFNKDTLEYTIEAPSDIEEINIVATKEDETATIEGDGKQILTEGENVFKIIVTSQKGTKKTYTLKINVKDDNPITVTINNEKYTVIKRQSALKELTGFTNKTITINNIKVPALYNEASNITLVGLKNKDGEINLFIYDDGEYTLYKELKSNTLTIIPINTNEKLPFKKSTIKLNKDKYNCYKISSRYSLIYGLNIETGKKTWYMYNTDDKTFQVYDPNIISGFINKINQSEKIILVLGCVSIFFALLLIITIAKNKKKIKRLQEKHNNDKSKTNEKTILDDTIEITKINEKKKPKKDEVQEVNEDSQENTDEIISKIDFDKTSTNIVTGKKELKKMKRVLDKDKKVQDKKKKEEIKEDKKYNNKANEKKLDEW